MKILLNIDRRLLIRKSIKVMRNLFRNILNPGRNQNEVNKNNFFNIYKCKIIKSRYYDFMKWF
jgi:hypothetical protein